MPFSPYSPNMSSRVNQLESNYTAERLKFLSVLAEKHPTLLAAQAEIVNLSAILNLPKTTEQFISDLHGAYDAVNHILRNASGNIRNRVEDLFAFTMTKRERNKLLTLIYYPEEKLPLVLKEIEDAALENEDVTELKNHWYRLVIYRLIQLTRALSAKYTRSKVKKALPKEFAYILTELISPQEENNNKMDYYMSVIESIIATEVAPSLIIQLCHLIQRLSVDHLHIVGDIYDRGSGAHQILDRFMEFHSLDIQWGNHDVLWMGAAAGSDVCIANVLRVSLRYNNMETIEDGYGINLLPLTLFVQNVYKDDPCKRFQPRLPKDHGLSDQEVQLAAKMQKAMAIIQFKLEGHIIDRHPIWNMEDRKILHRIDYSVSPPTVTFADGSKHELLDDFFPTIDPQNPYKLTPEERQIVLKLRHSFLNSRHLQKSINFLYEKGSMYLISNSNLLIHGGIPCNEDSSLTDVPLYQDGDRVYTFKGKALYDEMDRLLRDAFYLRDDSIVSSGQAQLAIFPGNDSLSGFDAQLDDTAVQEGALIGEYLLSTPSKKILKSRQTFGRDLAWWAWCGPHSPLFGRDAMKTFENYFIADKPTCKEKGNIYYKLREEKEHVIKFLAEFGVSPNGRIISGHTPVKAATGGESPIKAGGSMLVIDGGFSEAYHSVTGTAGYTLISSSVGVMLAGHKPFPGPQHVITHDEELLSSITYIETFHSRMRVVDTDTGVKLQRRIDDLKALVNAYKLGWIRQNTESK